MADNYKFATGAMGQPHPCECFGGYCWKNLCAERVVAKAQKQAEKTAAGTQTTKFAARPRVSAWRADGSHENGPVPEGRLPKKP